MTLEAWDWQLIVAVCIVAVAVVVLLRQTIRLWNSPSDHSCGGGCESCDASKPLDAGHDLVQLQVPPAKRIAN